MQKFTRSLTREIEVASERLALTLTDQGLSVRPVGSRKPPWEFPWSIVLFQLVGPGHSAGLQPTAEQMTATLELLRKGKAVEPAAAPASAGEPAPIAAPVAAEPPEVGQVSTPAVAPIQGAEPSP